MKLLFVLFSACMAILICSCGKNDDKPHNTLPVDTAVVPVDSGGTDTTPTPKDTLPLGWSKAKTPSDTSNVIDIFFANNTTGYAITAGGEVWKSGDGGLSWASVFKMPNGALGYNLSVTPNGNVFIVLAAQTNGIYKSTDNGATFGFQQTGTITLDPDVFFTGNDTGYISSALATLNNKTAYGLWQTTDGGNNWQFLEVAGAIPAGSHEMSFYNTAYGYIINYNNVTYTNGQYNQLTNRTLTRSNSLCSIAAPSALTAYAADRQGQILKSVDGGANFTILTTLFPATSAFINLHFTDEQTGYAAQELSLFKTTNGGSVWSSVFKWTSPLIEVHFTDAGHGWVCGQKGTILVYRK